MNLIVPKLRPIEQVDHSYANDVLRLFHGEWWSKKRSIADVRNVLEGSFMTFARVLTDYVYFGFIFDLIVDAELRGKGVWKCINAAND